MMLAACGTADQAGDAPEAADGLHLPAPGDPENWSSGRSPTFQVLTADGDQLELAAWTFCGPRLCADGAPPDDPPAIGSPEELVFGFEQPGWEFTDVTFRERGPACPRQITVAAERLGPRTFRVAPAGRAGDWDVDIFGRGPEGDAVTTVRWRTPVDGTTPAEATGVLAVLAEHDGELDSYGVELSLSDLASHPERATATVTVTSADGRSATLTPRPDLRCHTAGSVSFRGRAEAGLAATRLGQGPFDYRVELDLDGTAHVGRATWPDDEIEDYAPYAALTWSPPLPVHTG